MNNKTKPDKKTRIAVALSGGIDSAFAAYMLKEQGYEVFGITARTYAGGNFTMQLESVKRIAEKLGIEYDVLDIEEFFENKIIEPFCRSYLEGTTPNPCIECNKTIKFGLLWEKAEEHGADRIATGHYARLVKSENGKRFLLKKGMDKNKDQSYFLWKLTQKQLKTIRFPIGSLYKNEVRDESAKLFPFLNARAESQETCFIGKNSLQEFLKERYGNGDLIRSGTVLNTKGEIIGRHKGFIYYTVGQRRGLGISHSGPLYVKEIIPETNTIILGEEEEIYSNRFFVRDTNFISCSTPGESFNANTKIRYNSPEIPSEIQVLEGSRASVRTDIPQKAVAPGQSAVFYIDDVLLGGGIIE